jgi:hypothetical protein
MSSEEFDDSALIKSFGQADAGILAAHVVMSTEVTRQFRVEAIGETS